MFLAGKENLNDEKGDLPWALFIIVTLSLTLSQCTSFVTEVTEPGTTLPERKTYMGQKIALIFFQFV